jgi:Tfp pilus assembly protein PilF
LNLANLLLDQRKVGEAKALLLNAVQIAPQNPKIHEQLGHVYMADGQFEKAQAEFEQDIAISPNSGAFHYLLAQAYKHEGMREKAQLEFRRAADLDGAKATPAAP